MIHWYLSKHPPLKLSPLGFTTMTVAQKKKNQPGQPGASVAPKKKITCLCTGQLMEIKPHSLAWGKATIPELSFFSPLSAGRAQCCPTEGPCMARHGGGSGLTWFQQKYFHCRNVLRYCQAQNWAWLVPKDPACHGGHQHLTVIRSHHRFWWQFSHVMGTRRVSGPCRLWG